MQNSFVVDQKRLVTVLSSMLPICTKRSPLDATASVFFEVRHRELIIKSTDLEIALQASCSLESSSNTETIAFLVNGRRIYDVVKELEGPVTCVATPQQLTLQAGSVVVHLNVASAEQFPPFPERIENLTHIEKNCLAELLKGTMGSVPQNHANAALTGLLWEMGPEGIILTATDGHCLSQAKSQSASLGTYRQWIVPRRALVEINKLIENMAEASLFIGMCGKQLVLSGETFNFFTKVLNGPFPHYAPVLQRDTFEPALLDRSHLLKTLRRAASLLSGQFIATQFMFDQEAVHVHMHNKEVGTLQEDMKLESYKGERFEIKFYAPYLLHGLTNFPDEKITMYLKSATRPIIFETARTSGTRLTYLVMPVATKQTQE